MHPVEVVNIGPRVYCSMDDLIEALSALKDRVQSFEECEGIYKSIQVIEHVKLSFKVIYQ